MSESILMQKRGRFERGYPVGPVSWAHHDLIWVHSGAVDLRIEDAEHRLDGRTGALVPPGVTFHLSVPKGHVFCRASVIHFRHPDGPTAFATNRPQDGAFIAHLVEEGLACAERDPEGTARRRLAIVDLLVEYFRSDTRPATAKTSDRLEDVWRTVETELASMRTLSDVAALAGLSESRFRALHAAAYANSAGAYLRSIRLRHAADLLISTRRGIAEIASEVGYATASAFSTAFRKEFGVHPRAYRQQAEPFA